LPEKELKVKFSVINEEKKKEDLAIRNKHWLAEED